METPEIYTHINRGLTEVSEEIADSLLNRWVIMCSLPGPCEIELLHHNPIVREGGIHARVDTVAEQDELGVYKIAYTFKIHDADKEEAANQAIEQVIDAYRRLFSHQWFKVDLTCELVVDPDLE